MTRLPLSRFFPTRKGHPTSLSRTLLNPSLPPLLEGGYEETTLRAFKSRQRTSFPSPYVVRENPPVETNLLALTKRPEFGGSAQAAPALAENATGPHSSSPPPKPVSTGWIFWRTVGVAFTVLLAFIRFSSSGFLHRPLVYAPLWECIYSSAFVWRAHEVFTITSGTAVQQPENGTPL